MNVPMAEPGRYQARPTSWSIYESQNSESRGISIQYQCTLRLDVERDEYVPTEGPPKGAEGTVWIIGRDGTPNQRGIRDLARVFGWNGDLEQFAADSGWRPKDCEITVVEEEYNGKKRLKVAWINELGSKGRTKDTAKRLMSAYGDTFKRLISEPAAIAQPEPPTTLDTRYSPF